LLKIKHIFFASLFILLLYSCSEKVPQTPDEKAKALIADLFKTTRNGTYNYKPGRFGKLDSAYSSFRDDSLYMAYSDTVSHYMDKSWMAHGEVADIGYRTDTTRNEGKRKKLWKELLAASAKNKVFLDSVSFYSDKCNAVKDKYKPFFNGWKITHDYKANNGFGIPVDQKTTFYFNIQLTQIIGPKEIVHFERFKNLN
jgi:hypothetical protein